MFPNTIPLKNSASYISVPIPIDEATVVPLVKPISRIIVFNTALAKWDEFVQKLSLYRKTSIQSTEKFIQSDVEFVKARIITDLAYEESFRLTPGIIQIREFDPNTDSELIKQELRKNHHSLIPKFNK